MYTIGQFARIGQISANTLRYYDEIGLFSPAYVDPDTQYRYYQKEQVDEFIVIAELKKLGLSLAEIKGVSQISDPKLLKETLNRKLQELNQQIRKINDTKQYILEKLAALDDGKIRQVAAKQYVIELKNRKEMAVLSYRARTNISDIGNLIGKVFERMHLGGYKAIGSHLTIYHDQEFDPEDTDIEVCIPVESKGNNNQELKIIPAGLFACTIHYGAFTLLGKAHAAVLDWINEHNYEISRPCLEIYNQFPGPAHHQCETEICYRVKDKGSSNLAMN